MPVYDYRCDRCAAQFEVRQSFSDDTLKTCPPEGGPSACTAPGRGPVKKVFSGVAISFKGEGFYKNDHGAIAAGRKKETEAASSKDSSKESTSTDAVKSSASSGSDSNSKSSGSDSKRPKADASASSS